MPDDTPASRAPMAPPAWGDRASALETSALFASLARLEEENAMLRRALDERSLAPATRRWLGQAIAVLILAGGTALGALYVTHNRQFAAARDGMREGWEAGSADAIVAPTAPAAPVAPIAPLAPIAPRVPRAP